MTANVADSLNPALAFLAGALTILSPCVLPLVPIVLAAAAQRHRFGPLALVTGLVIAFTTVGFTVATLGGVGELGGGIVRQIGAVLIILMGVAMALERGSALLARIATPLAAWATARQDCLERHGLVGQAVIGALLGIVWSPCVGPTLGAATVLAGQGRSLVMVAVVMGAFGLGIATVLLALALASRSVLTRWRAKLMQAGAGGKRLLGVMLVLVGLFILTGADRIAEAAVVAGSPDWLIDLTTRF